MLIPPLTKRIRRALGRFGRTQDERDWRRFLYYWRTALTRANNHVKLVEGERIRAVLPKVKDY